MKQISSEDRALIDAAITAGMVRHIPMGVSAFDPTKGIDYREMSRMLARRNARKTAVSTRPRRPDPDAQRTEKRAQRAREHAELKALHDAGMTMDQIAEHTGLVKSQVWIRLKKWKPDGSTS